MMPETQPLQEDKEPNNTCLSFMGGGAKGFVHIGVMLELDRLGLLDKFTRVSGSSVGAIGALLMASGKSPSELREILTGLNLNKLVHHDLGIWSIFRLLTRFGLLDAPKLSIWLGDIVESVTGNRNATFAQWHAIRVQHPERHMRDLFIDACNVNTRFNETFSYLSKEHQHDPIVKVIRGSMAIPLYFTPEIIGGFLYADGGLQNNSPINIFNENIDEALGIWLDDGQAPKHLKTVKGFTDYLASIIDASLNTQSFAMLSPEYQKRMIVCQTKGISTFKFDLTPDEKQELISAGRLGIAKYFIQNYPTFAKRYYPAKFLNAQSTPDLEKALSEVIRSFEAIGSTPSPSLKIEDAAQSSSSDKLPSPTVTRPSYISYFSLRAWWQYFRPTQPSNKTQSPQRTHKPKTALP